MTSSSHIDAASSVISEHTWVEAIAKDTVEFKCNMTRCSEVFYVGKDYDMGLTDWLGTAINHLVAVHPEVFK